MRKIITKEERVAKKIVDSLTDVTLDLDQVGMTIAHLTSTVMFNRVQTVAEASAFEKEKLYDRLNINPLF
jgi:3-oxoacyl-(acyl-carrier-protein) synthase